MSPWSTSIWPTSMDEVIYLGFSTVYRDDQTLSLVDTILYGNHPCE